MQVTYRLWRWRLFLTELVSVLTASCHDKKRKSVFSKWLREAYVFIRKVGYLETKMMRAWHPLCWKVLSIGVLSAKTTVLHLGEKCCLHNCIHVPRAWTYGKVLVQELWVFRASFNKKNSWRLMTRETESTVELRVVKTEQWPER